jgi:hypothetical protein
MASSYKTPFPPNKKNPVLGGWPAVVLGAIFGFCKEFAGG